MSNNNPKNFLSSIGYILVIAAVLGFIGVLGPTPDQSIFGTYLWMSTPFSLIYLVLGIISLYLSYTLMDASIVLPFTFFLGAVGLFVGLYGLFWAPRIMGIELNGMIGNLFNLVAGAWGVWTVSAERFALMRRCREGDMEACNILGMQVRQSR